MGDYVILFCTVPKRKDGDLIGEKLVREKLAACVSVIGTMRSLYTWKGEVCRDDEHLLIIKSRNALFNRIKEVILSVHPYDVPEILSVSIVDGHDAYLKWIDEVTTAL